jgi:PERQ amino acid-rich with GYF domain-containing protein
MDDTPVTSTHDFLKWLSDTLKGLNHSVNLEDMTQMLLSFPLDPDPSTSEIISDLIYANSTTLDGRRFAAEFVKRRRASGAAGPGPNGNGKVSIADVVKTTPRAAQPEWGFKVVNKKKKGRA